MRIPKLPKPAFLAPLKRLIGDRRGNVLAITAAAMPLVLGSVGLATDTVQWALWKRQLQRAADSAAFAGTYARLDAESSTTAVTYDLENNNHLWVALRSGYPIVTDLTDTTTQVAGVEVSLSVQQPLTFSAMFMDEAPIITVNARAAAIDADEFCVVGLDESSQHPAITIQGNTTVNLGCGIISNSRHATRSVNPNGTSFNITAEPVAGAGGVPTITGTNTVSYHSPQPDPYLNKYSTDIPSGMNCTNMNQKVVNPAPTAGVTTLAPGCYTGQNQFRFNGGDYHLQPGVYYLNGTNFDAMGGRVTGTGVTIILTGSSPGNLNMNGNANVQLTAPTTGPYAKMLFIQSANAVDSTNANNTVNGTSASSFDGAFYFPKQQINFSGTSGNMTKCTMIVAKRVDFSGNSNIQNNTSGCVNPDKFPGKTVRLIG